MKTILRKNLIKKRKIRYTEINTKHILKIYEFLKKKHKTIKLIGGYIPINFEYDCASILKFLETKNYTISLPVIKNNFQMSFYKYSFKDPLKINNLGIPEPLSLSNKLVPDLIFVPIVGYDEKLNRLGYGGGYYDRYIHKLSNKKRLLKIGFAFSYQKINKVPINKYDKKLDIIITEKYILR